jgi:hypothetical protein
MAHYYANFDVSIPLLLLPRHASRSRPLDKERTQESRGIGTAFGSAYSKPTVARTIEDFEFFGIPSINRPCG